MAAAEGGGGEPGGQGAGAGRQGEEEAEEQGVEAEEGESGGQPPGEGGAEVVSHVTMWMDAKYLFSPPGLVAVVGSQLACVSCGQEMAPPRTILQCSYGHNLCGPCAQDSEVGTVQTAVQYSTATATTSVGPVPRTVRFVPVAHLFRLSLGPWTLFLPDYFLHRKPD